MNPFDVAFFSAPSCIPCCGAAPAECSCALLIPPFGSPYADYATAETAIADQTSNCLGYVEYSPSGDPDNVFTAAFDGTTLELDGTTDGNGALPGTRSLDTWASVSMLSGGVLSVAYVITTDGTDYETTIELLDCADGTVLDSDTAATATGTLTVTAPADGEYVLHIKNSAGVGTIDANYVTATNDVTCSSAFWVNPVIALWDDSGTTRKLWACPKLLLPPLTESTGDWYADCAAADDVLTDTTPSGALYVSNCVGYQGDVSGVDGFTATDGGTTLTFNNTSSTVTGGAADWWGGINAEDGETITATISTDGGTYTASLNIYDDEGVLVESVDCSGGSGTSAALPYTGRYTVELAVQFPPPGGTPYSTITGTITSSGTLSVNEIQARYDLGLTCAATLDCGDTCP